MSKVVSKIRSDTTCVPTSATVSDLRNERTSCEISLTNVALGQTCSFISLCTVGICFSVSAFWHRFDRLSRAPVSYENCLLAAVLPTVVAGTYVGSCGDAPAASGGKEPPPPTWDGSDPGLLLATFEKNVRLWEYESEIDPKNRGVPLLRNLTSVARTVCDTLEFEEVANERGVAGL